MTTADPDTVVLEDPCYVNEFETEVRLASALSLRNLSPVSQITQFSQMHTNKES